MEIERKVTLFCSSIGRRALLVMLVNNYEMLTDPRWFGSRRSANKYLLGTWIEDLRGERTEI